MVELLLLLREEMRFEEDDLERVVDYSVWLME